MKYANALAALVFLFKSEEKVQCEAAEYLGYSSMGRPRNIRNVCDFYNLLGRCDDFPDQLTGILVYFCWHLFYSLYGQRSI